MATNSLPDAKPTKNARQGESANSPVTGHQGTPSAPILKRPLPRASVEKANKVFANFSVSKFAKGSTPANYVPEAKNPAAVQAVQRKIISRHMKTLNDSGATNQGMTLALPEEEIKQLLPSYSEEARTVELSDVLGLLTKKMSGTEFYANGNPTLNRLALQSQVDQIIQSVKQSVTQEAEK